MSSMPAVKITRAGIEVNEVPTDLSVLEDRVTAMEAKNQEQDAIFETNDGRILAVKSTADNNTARLLVLTAVETAVAALQALSHSEVSLESVNVAISALQNASVSNAATIAAVSTALTDLESGKVANAEAAIAALQALVGGVQVTTLATKAQVDLKKDDGTKSTFGTEFKAVVTGILDNSVFPADQDWANTYSLTTNEETSSFGITVTGYAGISATDNPDKKSINMAVVMENDTDRFEHYAGIRGLGTSEVESEAFSNAHLIQFNNTIPFAMTLGKAMSTGNILDRETDLNDIIPKYSNISFIQVVRELSPVESKFYEDSGEATAPIVLSRGQSIRKIKVYSPNPDTSNVNNRYVATVFDHSDVVGNSYVVVEPAENATVEHCLSQSLGLWTNRGDINSAAYKLRASMEFEKIDQLITAGELDDTVYTSNSSNSDMGAKYSMYAYVIGAPDEKLHAFKRLEKFVDTWCDKEYVLEAPHGVMQYDLFQYTVPAIIEHLYLTDAEKLDHSNARTAWDITKEEVFDVIGLEMPGGSHINLNFDANYNLPSGQYGGSIAGLGGGTHYYYSYETANPFGIGFIPEATYAALSGKYMNFNGKNYMSIDDVMKLCRVVARRGVMDDGSRLINPDIFEALFMARMTTEQPATATALDGTVDNCYGSLWRGVSCFGAPVRGPGVLAAEAYLRNDRATNLDTLSLGGSPPVIAFGDLTTWVVETPPQRCIVMPVSANTGNYVTIYPDSHTVTLILTDDSIETRLGEYKSITSEIYKHLA